MTVIMLSSSAPRPAPASNPRPRLGCPSSSGGGDRFTADDDPNDAAWAHLRSYACTLPPRSAQTTTWPSEGRNRTGRHGCAWSRKYATRWMRRGPTTAPTRARAASGGPRAPDRERRLSAVDASRPKPRPARAGELGTLLLRPAVVAVVPDGSTTSPEMSPAEMPPPASSAAREPSCTVTRHTASACSESDVAARYSPVGDHAAYIPPAASPDTTPAADGSPLIARCCVAPWSPYPSGPPFTRTNSASPQTATHVPSGDAAAAFDATGKEILQQSTSRASRRGRRLGPRPPWPPGENPPTRPWPAPSNASSSSSPRASRAPPASSLTSTDIA